MRNFDRFADQVAREAGERDPTSLAASYRAAVDRRFAPPIVGPIAPLSDLFIHTRDIERPLGRASQLDPAGLRTVLDFVCGGKAVGFVPRARTKGLRLEATDLGWSGGGEAIMLAVTSRRSAVADLSGDGVAVLDRRLG